MAMASPGTRVVPESSSKLMGGLNLSITPEDCEEGGYGAWSPCEKAAHPPSAHNPLSSTASSRAASDYAPHNYAPHNIDLISDSSSSSTSSYKGKLPVVLEESESLSHREGSSVWDISSSSSSLSIASSTASSTRALFRRGTSVDRPKHKHKSRDSHKLYKKRSEGHKISFMSVLLWPLRKLRDGYMSCMMGLEGTGDLSGLAQGSTFATSTKYFADLPISKADAKNYG